MTFAATPHAGLRVLACGAPIDRAAVVVVLLHGRGAGPENIVELADRFGRSDVHYLVPAAAGRTWYPQSFLAPRDQNEPWLSSALAAVGLVVDGVIARGVASSRVVLAGFSQGACLATEFVHCHDRRLGGLVAFSGGLIGPPGTTWTRSTTVEGMPVFFGDSDRDAHVPQWRVEESAAAFTAAGARVTTRIYPGMGHLVIDDEIAHARTLLDDVASR